MTRGEAKASNWRSRRCSAASSSVMPWASIGDLSSEYHIFYARYAYVKLRCDCKKVFVKRSETAKLKMKVWMGNWCSFSFQSLETCSNMKNTRGREISCPSALWQLPHRSRELSSTPSPASKSFLEHTSTVLYSKQTRKNQLEFLNSNSISSLGLE